MRPPDPWGAAGDPLLGRPEAAFPVPEHHAVLGTRLLPPFPAGLDVAVFAMGCFWGAERLFWRQPGVWSTLAGYAAGWTPHPTYEEVATGRTGHAQVVQVVYDASRLPYHRLLRTFWTGHDPTQRMRQGHDVGSQYRSMVLVRDSAQAAAAATSRARYQGALYRAGHGAIATEIARLDVVYPAEPYHQQYLHRVPDGYCGLGGTGVAYPVRGGRGDRAQVQGKPRREEARRGPTLEPERRCRRP
jgi:peptide-methionine (S)-S-oxide reductase